LVTTPTVRIPNSRAAAAIYQPGPLVQCCNALRHPTRSLVNTEHAVRRVAQALVQKIHVEFAREATHKPPANVVKGKHLMLRGLDMADALANSGREARPAVVGLALAGREYKVARLGACGSAGARIVKACSPSGNSCVSRFFVRSASMRRSRRSRSTSDQRRPAASSRRSGMSSRKRTRSRIGSSAAAVRLP
jgi:hypothetical protein